MSFAVYILRCADNSYYTGHTDDLERRVAEHQSGAVRGYTYERRPIELVWADHVGTREEALTAELKIKGWSRAKKEAWIGQNWRALSKAAMPPSERETRAKAMLADGNREIESRVVGVPPPENSGAPLAALELVPRLRSGGTGSVVVSSPTPPPVIVLVRPQLAENIGKAARAMLNFGLTELRLVAPRDGWPNPEAGPAASGADQVIGDAQVYDSVGDAVADCAHIYATTVRKRGVMKPVVSPEDAALAIRAAPERSAILFGPERSGLATEDVAVARTIVTVPINPAFGSLNLAQAVMVVAYEWSRGAALAQPPRRDDEPPAPQFELDGMIAQLDLMLDQAGFFFPPDKAPLTRNMLRSLLTKPGWSAQEVRTLRGVLSTLQSPQPSNRSSS